MKKDFSARPDTISAQYCEVCGGFSWYDFVTAIPSLVFVVTGWKSNGKENACLQSWSSFAGGGTDDFISKTEQPSYYVVVVGKSDF